MIISWLLLYYDIMTLQKPQHTRPKKLWPKRGSQKTRQMCTANMYASKAISDKLLPDFDEKTTGKCNLRCLLRIQQVKVIQVTCSCMELDKVVARSKWRMSYWTGGARLKWDYSSTSGTNTRKITLLFFSPCHKIDEKSHTNALNPTPHTQQLMNFILSSSPTFPFSLDPRSRTIHLTMLFS